MSIRKHLWLLVAVLLCPPLFAAQNALRDGHPDRYVVQKGDTLWDISKHFLRDPWLWPEIWHKNPEIRNPHLIYPGDVISLVYIDGQPRLTVKTEDRVGEVIKLTASARALPLDSAIPTIPLDAIRPFLSESRVVEERVLDEAPYLLAADDRKVAASKGDKVYARNIRDNETNYSVVRKGRSYVDPDTKQVLGVEALHVGDATLLNSGDPASLRLIRSNREVLPGDRLLPRDDTAFESNFYPKAPSATINGRIIDVVDGVSQIGQYNVVAINRGKRHGLEVGDVLAVYQVGETVRDPYSKNRGEKVRLPDELAGRLIVFRTFEQMSLGLVMETFRPLHVMDSVRNP